MGIPRTGGLQVKNTVRRTSSTLVPPPEQNGVDKKRGRVMLNRLDGRKRGELYGGREAEIARSLKNTRIRNPEIEDQQRVRETT